MPNLSLVRIIRDLVEPAVERMGFDLVAVEFTTGRRRALLRLSIDGSNGVGADDCARVSLWLSPLLDDADPISAAYDLEVSSPGIERPVQRLSDFARFVGFRVRVRLEEGMPRRRYTGVVAGVEGQDVHLLVDGVTHELAFDTIDRAHLVLDLEEYTRLAQSSPGTTPDGDVGASGN
jgi:ribosome maturation factor RimP